MILANLKSRIKDIYTEIISFFPVQLLINNFKKNQILLFFWFILFLTISGDFGSSLGIPLLFLDPEYQNDVSPESMAIVGVCFGVFCVSFFITCYILDSHRFKFLGTIRFPFVNFCLNNSILPLAFVITYLGEFIHFQFESGFEKYGQILIQAFCFILAFVLTITFFLMYFRLTNKTYILEFVDDLDYNLRKKRFNRVQVMKRIKGVKKIPYNVRSYLHLGFNFERVNQNIPVDKTSLFKLIDQHHFNAVTVESVIFISIIITGIFQDNPIFQIPAAASGLLLFSFFIMFTGAFSYWLRGWAITGIILLFVVMNSLVAYEFISSTNQAFGINYETVKSDYSLNRIRSLCNQDTIRKDIWETEQILNKWRAKFPANKKPKLVLLCASGGGQRSATWALNSLQFLELRTHGQLMKHSVLMTGASGGLIGLSYFRELYLRSLTDSTINLYSDEYINNISKDILNPIIFSMVVSDLFLRFQKVRYGDQEYNKDRGYAFEKQLNINTGFILDKTLDDYKEPELNAKIPMLLVAPTIINDGRKLYITPIHSSYMNTYYSNNNSYQERVRAVEFKRFFEKQSAGKLNFLSALRMSATFPYVTPNVNLPSSPQMEIMDAGLSDNYGIKDATHFLYTFKDWIETNTSGVILISIRDTEKYPGVEQNSPRSIWSKVFNPIGGVINNWDNNQDFSNDNSIEFAYEWFNGDLDVINISYCPKPHDWNLLEEKHIDPNKIRALEKKERASLSWHLTTREKESIKRTIFEQENLSEINRLIKLLEK